MVDHIRIKRDGRVVEPPRGATGYGITIPNWDFIAQRQRQWNLETCTVVAT